MAEGPGDRAGEPPAGSEGDWEAERERFREADAAARARAAPVSGPGGFAGATQVPDLDDDGPLAREFVALADHLFAVPAEAGVAALLEHILEAAARLVPGASLLSVVLRADGVYRTVAFSHPDAARVDALQEHHGEGPGLAATEERGIGVSIAPSLTESSWPAFAHDARALGVSAAMSTGMFPGGSPPRFGALNYYAFADHGLDRADRDQALLLAAHAATAIAGVQARSAAEVRASHLEVALQSRDVIGQAKGVLMERRGLDADAAFDVLRRTSQDLNVKLRDLAETVVSRRSDL